MSLRKKIFFSFFVSAFIIAVLAVFEYVNFVQVKNEMRSLEVTDTIRSTSLQLRRHEKNFLLYPQSAETEMKAIDDYLAQLDDVTRGLQPVSEGKHINVLVGDYKTRFEHIVTLHREVEDAFQDMQSRMPEHDRSFIPLIEANFLDRPGYMAEFLEKFFPLSYDHPLVSRLRELDGEIATLRINGEDIIEASKALDVAARAKAEQGIHASHTAILVVFPLFLVIGLATLFFISNDLVRRLNTLTASVDKTGSKFITQMPVPERAPEHKDEVDVLVDKFRRMGEQLDLWQDELHEKNRELLESKKLAAIGTLASGVAHELNNPLNNIFLSVQVLKRSLGDDSPAQLKEVVEEIMGQTTRVKGIVGDLLEFAREREPRFENIDITGLIRKAYDLARKSTHVEGIELVIDSPPSVILRADPNLMERVFINLFSNALAAISGGGEVVAKVEEGDKDVKIWVSDNGEGMSEEDKDKVFDPFFTKKDKGTGLGLAIVLSIIKKHNGTITVESYKGEGTAFEITLPRG